MMSVELTKLYVLVVKGEKHYFGSKTDRSYAWNIMTENGTFDYEQYEIDLEK